MAKCENPSCGKDIPVYVGMGGSGFESVSFTQDPPKKNAEGKWDEGAVHHLELCKECYKEDFAKAHPNSELPKLPGEMPQPS